MIRRRGRAANQHRPPYAVAGMTLVEMLVAMAAMLLLLGIVAQLFSMVGRGVNGSRDAVDMASGARSIQFKLRQDLANATALGATPPLRPEANLGYFELIEGPETDRIAWYVRPDGAWERFEKDSYFVAGEKKYGNDAPLKAYVEAVGSDDRLVGDTDDILLMTVHNPSEPFSGRLDATNPAAKVAQSPCAEVIWFCRPTPNTLNPRLHTLHRRQRIVMAQPGASPFVSPTADINANAPAPSGDGVALPNTATDSLFDATDVSCRLERNPLNVTQRRLVPNTLGDLTKRENRFLHGGGFPHPFDPEAPNLALSGDRLGEDVVLTNVISFDVRVVDRDAVVKIVDTDTAVTPGEAGWPTGVVSGQTGAFVDLNWRQEATPLPFTSALPGGGDAFKGLGVNVLNTLSPSNLLQPTRYRDRRQQWATYDTWSSHYERNGVDDDGRYDIDQGFNQIDDDSNGRVDEPEEGETRPPYPTRLRAIEIRIRCYEPASRQIRQVTIRHSM
jgi:hypothetical protein